MELRQLRYFVKSAELMNFTAAAAECCISQSTLSQQIKELENDLGFALFDRIGKRVRLTRNGQEFLTFAERIIADVRHSREWIDDIQSLKTGTIHIGCTWGLSSLLTKTIGKMQKLYPGIRYDVIYRKADELIEMLHAQTIDFALSFNITSLDEDIEKTKLFESTLCAVVADDHPLAHFKRMPLKMLKEYPIAVPYKGMNAREMFDRFVEREHLDIKPTVEINEIYTLLKLVKRNKWIAIVADSVIFDEEGMTAIPFETGRIPMDAILMQLKGVYVRKDVRAFLDNLSLE